MSQENVDLVRRGWDAWIRGDLARLFGLFDADVVWDRAITGTGPSPRIAG
jgi:ketosteroid isomerase-like protein